MKVYHGSNMEIVRVDLAKCRPFKDFGCGFYTTRLEEQAWQMAKRRVEIEKSGVPTVTVFDMPDDLAAIKELNCKIFAEQPTVEWAIFIKNNRDRYFRDISSAECNTDNKYDIVAGLVADDTVGLLIRQFSRGTIDLEYLKRELDFNKLTNQYSFHTVRALQYLKRMGAET